MKGLIALLCALVILVPFSAFGNLIQTVFPPSANFFAEIATSSSVDGLNHQHMGINLENLDLFFVQMAPSGFPTGGNGYPWLYGRISSVQQINANTFRVFWTVSASAGGINAAFIPIGQISIDFVI